MKFLADENVDRPVVLRLRQEGHVVTYIRETEPGAPDEEILDQATQQTAILVTADKDFAELVFRQGREPYGVILLRLAGLSPGRKASLVSTAVAHHGAGMAHNFTVVSPASVRIRATPARDSPFEPR